MTLIGFLISTQFIEVEFGIDFFTWHDLEIDILRILAEQL